jgi:hypothetical protein
MWNTLFSVEPKGKKTSSVRSVGGDKAKIIICGVHVTEEEFIHTLMSNKEVDLNFMWICCVAIMLDWGSTTKTILNQPLIVCFPPIYYTVTVGSLPLYI